MSISKKLLKTLKLISKKDKELERLRKFVHFQKEQEVIGRIFDFLVKHYPSYQKVSNDDVWNVIFPKEKKLNEAVLRVYYSNLNELIEQFLIFEQVKKNKALQQQLLSRAYDEKNQYERFFKNNTSAQKILQEQTSSAQQLSEIAFLKQTAYTHQQHKVNDEKEIDEIIKLIDESHLMSKLKFAVESLSRAGIYQNKVAFPFLQELIKFAQQTDFQENIIIKIYVLLAELYQYKTAEYYQLASGFFEKNRPLFEQTESQAIHLHLQNFLIRESNNGNEAIALVFFEKQKNIFEQQLKDSKKMVISEQSFLNMVSAACLGTQLDYLDNFIPENGQNIAGENKKIVLVLAKANLSFYRYLNEKKVQYLDEILENTREIESLKGDLAYNLLLRMNICKTYFEYLLLNNQQGKPLEDYLKSFETYLKKQSLTKEKSILYVNFCRQLSQILKVFEDITLRKKEKSDALNQIKENIQTMNIGNKQWLINKTQEIR
jgi:hypothetical protein